MTLVPSFISFPFRTPSPSQSKACQARLVPELTLLGIKLHPLNGSVLSVASFEFITPSPSQSSLEVTARVILSILKEQLFRGSVSSSDTSFPPITPSPSQSTPILVTSTDLLSALKLQAFLGSVLSVSSSPFMTPSPSQSKTFHSEAILLNLTSRKK